MKLIGQKTIGAPFRKGEHHRNAKINKLDVLTIRARRFKGEYYREIADDYGLSVQAVWKIVNRITWTHV
jgi:Mor family transcriptional regulator